MAKTNLTEEEKAIETLQKIESEKIKKATDAFNVLLEEWKKEYGCGLIAVGEFHGNQIKTGIKIIRIKK